MTTLMRHSLQRRVITERDDVSYVNHTRVVVYRYCCCCRCGCRRTNAASRYIDSRRTEATSQCTAFSSEGRVRTRSILDERVTRDVISHVPAGRLRLVRRPVHYTDTPQTSYVTTLRMCDTGVGKLSLIYAHLLEI